MIGDVYLLLSEPPHVGSEISPNMYACEDGKVRSYFNVQLISCALDILKNFEKEIERV